MIYVYFEVIKKYGNRYNLKKALDKKKIFKVERGIYSDKKTLNPLIIYSKKYPSGVITMDTAFYFYNLTDVIPNKIFIATPSNYRTIKNNKISQIFMRKEILNAGKEKVKIDDCDVYMYNKERLLVEIIRKRNKIPFDYYKEIISNYREIVDELDMQKVEEYLSLFKNDINLSEVIQREVF